MGGGESWGNWGVGKGGIGRLLAGSALLRNPPAAWELTDRTGPHCNYFGPTIPIWEGACRLMYFRLLKIPLIAFTEETYVFCDNKQVKMHLNKNRFLVPFSFHNKIVQICRCFQTAISELPRWNFTICLGSKYSSLNSEYIVSFSCCDLIRICNNPKNYELIFFSKIEQQAETGRGKGWPLQ